MVIKIVPLTLLMFLVGVQAIGQKEESKEKSVVKQNTYINNKEFKKEFLQNIPEDVSINTGIKIGERAPNIKVKDINGNIIDLSALRGKKVILNFWATWCPPCKSELPTLAKFYKQHHRDIEIIGINIESTKADVQKFMKQFGITYPIIIDKSDSISDQYQIQPIPTTYFIDENGIVYHYQFGALTLKDLNALMNHQWQSFLYSRKNSIPFGECYFFLKTMKKLLIS